MKTTKHTFLRDHPTRRLRPMYNKDSEQPPISYTCNLQACVLGLSLTIMALEVKKRTTLDRDTELPCHERLAQEKSGTVRKEKGISGLKKHKTTLKP